MYGICGLFLNLEKKIKFLKDYVENNLMLDMNDVQAKVLFTQKLEESLQSKQFNFDFYFIKNRIRPHCKIFVTL